MKFTRKKIVIAVIAAVAASGIGFAATRKPAVSYETETVVRGTVVEEVAVTGSLAPTRKIALEPEVSGRLVSLAVDEGSVVAAGAILAEIDARDVEARIASQRAALNSAKARLAELAAGATAAELSLAETAVATAESRKAAAVAAKVDAQVAFANAQANAANVAAKADTLMAGKLEALLLGYDEALNDAFDAVERLSGPLFTNNDLLTFSTTNFSAEVAARNTRGVAKAALADLAAAVVSAKAAGTADAALAAYPSVAADLAAVKAHLEADRDALTYASGIPSSTLETYKLNVSAGINAVNAVTQRINGDKSAVDLQAKLNAADETAAQISLANAQAGLTSATFAVDTAEKTLAQAKADLALKKIGTRPEVIAAQRARVEAEDATLSSLLADLSKRRIVSPIDGIVTDVAIEIGETVGPGKTAVAVQAKGNFEITANVSEIDVGKVAIGHPVGITLDAFPRDERWTGKVTSIHPAEKIVEGVIFYETTVTFDNDDPRLRSGMTANLTIETGRKDGVLRVPLRGVEDRRDKTFVDVLEGGAPIEREIVIGLRNNDYAEAASGLAEGDAVVVTTVTKK